MYPELFTLLRRSSVGVGRTGSLCPSRKGRCHGERAHCLPHCCACHGWTKAGVAVDSSALTFLEEEKRTDQLDDLILSGAHVSAADRAARRRWALNPPSLRGGRRKKRKRRKKLPKASSGHGRPCDHATPVPAVFAAREREGASDSVHRRTLELPAGATETGPYSANCAGIWRFHAAVVATDWCWGWSRQCRKWRLHSCSSWTGLWSCPLLCKTGVTSELFSDKVADMPILLVQTVQMQFLDKVICRARCSATTRAYGGRDSGVLGQGY